MEAIKRHKFLFLYSELAGYMLSCMKLLTELYPYEIYMVRWPVNKEAPFDFNFPEHFHVKEKNEFTFETLQEYVKQINPDIIYCSGWMDKEYVKICKQYRKKIPVITAFDNKWKGTLKQHIATIVSPFTIKKYFSHCFVAGSQQFEYAVKLGFSKQNILTGLYAADVDFFYNQYIENKESKSKKFPHRFIYVGRYYEFNSLFSIY